MTPLGSESSRRWRIILAVTLVAITLAATWTGLGNIWVQDDIPIIFSNEALHSLAAPWHFFTAAYWPPPFPHDLYRPLTVLMLASEWAVGHGGPLAFRIGSILLYVVAVLAVWRLARRLLAPSAAFVAAALFAAHPVHVEAVAVAVNQAELMVALVLTLGVTAWIDRRRAGLPVTGRWGAGLGALYLFGMLFKENAAVLPALLVAAEVTLLARVEVPRLTKPEWRRLLVGGVFILVVVLFVRNQVLGGDIKGTFTAEALEGQGFTGRLLTMLGVVPQWGRLLVWPHYLRADYSPQVIMPAMAFGAAQALGVLLLVLAVTIFVRARTRAPEVAFGVAWLAIGLGPVHNVLVPTGIVLAERTLFLPSIGFVLGGIALLDLGRQALVARRTPLVNQLAVAGVGALLVMGVTRSASRQRVWHDLGTFYRQTLIDAPESYRAHHAFAQMLFKEGYKGSAEWHYREALRLWPDAYAVALDLADKYRLDAKCYPAIRIYEAVLASHPDELVGRASLIACLLYVGDYVRAANYAAEGISISDDPEAFRRYLETADSAAANHAPAGTVRLKEVSDSTERRP